MARVGTASDNDVYRGTYHEVCNAFGLFGNVDNIERRYKTADVFSQCSGAP